MTEYLSDQPGWQAGLRGGAAPLNSTPGGLVVARCDPFGAESRIRLFGGLYPDSQVGRIMWHCQNPSEGRWRMTCLGGQYGQRVAADGGGLPAYRCDGGHRGQPMDLCRDHVKMIKRRQAGLCPKCAFPPEAIELKEALERCQTDMHNAYTFGFLVAAAKLGQAHADMSARLTELYHRGIIHRCPLNLTEVS
jgi:hypothetical protein